MNWLLGKIGLNKIKVNAHDIQKKFGLFGEPMFIGLLVGLLIGIIGEFKTLNTLAGWGTVSGVAVATAAIMAVFPKVGGIFASAFSALTEAFRAKAAKSGEGREWYLAVNDAAGYGEPNTLTTGILLMPIMLGLAFILPGNSMLPMADLVALPYMVEVFVCVSHGNVIKSIIMGAIWFSIGMIVCSSLVHVAALLYLSVKEPDSDCPGNCSIFCTVLPVQEEPPEDLHLPGVQQWIRLHRSPDSRRSSSVITFK